MSEKQNQFTQREFIPWNEFLQMTPAEIEATFGSETNPISNIVADIIRDVRQLEAVKKSGLQNSSDPFC